MERAEEFFEHHGSKTIVLARFVPVVRTFAPIVAGVSSMRYRTFVAYNVIGAFLWAIGVTLLGYWLGETVPNIDKYLLPIIFGIIVLSLVPVWVEYRRQKNKAAKSASSAPRRRVATRLRRRCQLTGCGSGAAAAAGADGESVIEPPAALREGDRPEEHDERSRRRS